jgi:hypothetical protein
MNAEPRKAICRTCPHFRVGPIRIEQWCHKFDDQPQAQRNCDGAKHRRFQTRLAAPEASCDLWTTDTPPIHLPSIKTIVYTTSWRRYQHYQIHSLLTQRGFTDWHFHYGEKFEGSGDFRAFIAMDYAKIFAREKAPLLFLEDDIDINKWHPYLHIPPDTQIAMLGGGRWGRQDAIRHARHLYPDIRRTHRYGWLPINEQWMRVFGMLGSHAYLFLDQETLQAVSRVVNHPVPADQSLALNQHLWYVACLRVPIFMQAGRNITRDYAPPLPLPPEEPHLRRARLRSERQALLRR